MTNKFNKTAFEENNFGVSAGKIDQDMTPIDFKNIYTPYEKPSTEAKRKPSDW